MWFNSACLNFLVLLPLYILSWSPVFLLLCLNAFSSSSIQFFPLLSPDSPFFLFFLVSFCNISLISFCLFNFSTKFYSFSYFAGTRRALFLHRNILLILNFHFFIESWSYFFLFRYPRTFFCFNFLWCLFYFKKRGLAFFLFFFNLIFNSGLVWSVFVKQYGYMLYGFYDSPFLHMRSFSLHTYAFRLSLLLFSRGFFSLLSKM